MYAEFLLPSFPCSLFFLHRRKLLDEKMTRFPSRLKPFASDGGEERGEGEGRAGMRIFRSNSRVRRRTAFNDPETL